MQSLYLYVLLRKKQGLNAQQQHLCDILVFYMLFTRLLVLVLVLWLLKWSALLWTSEQWQVISVKFCLTSRGRPSPHLSGSPHSTSPEGYSWMSLSWGHSGRSCSAAWCCTAQNLLLKRRKPEHFRYINTEKSTCFVYSWVRCKEFQKIRMLFYL